MESREGARETRMPGKSPVLPGDLNISLAIESSPPVALVSTPARRRTLALRCRSSRENLPNLPCDRS
jgi:hypothetical protein